MAGMAMAHGIINHNIKMVYKYIKNAIFGW